MGSTDRHVELSLEYSGWSRAQLGQRRIDGDTDRAQRRSGRRKGSGDDGARHPAASGTCPEGVGLLQQRSDEGRHIPQLAASGRSARNLAESKNNGRVPASDEGFLLRPVKI